MFLHTLCVSYHILYRIEISSYFLSTQCRNSGYLYSENYYYNIIIHTLTCIHTYCWTLLLYIYIDMWEAINQHVSLATSTKSPVLHVMIAEKVVVSLSQVFNSIITYVQTLDTSNKPELRYVLWVLLSFRIIICGFYWVFR